MKTKSKLAKARDKWLQSDDGKECSIGEANGQYLHNRIERAFIAGWDASEKSLQAEIERLKKAFEKYGQHLRGEGCPLSYKYPGGYKCTCGFEQVLKEKGG